MNESRKEMEWKRMDYERFSLTLIMLSSYFYIGAIIKTYIEPARNGELLFILACTSLALVVVLFYKRHQIMKKLDQDEHVN
ncbi:YrhC family protein [Virgibacillus sp. W0430]|uniref:YrhC family protein n=1 Tax=Virgibacillus sp. W0430 TaxID=3391580 RepID=UPI003F478892